MKLSKGERPAWRRWIGAALVAGALVAGASSPFGGAQAQADADSLFRRLDVDGDGVVTLADLEALAERRVARIDTDGDGRITRAELRAFEKQWAVMRAVTLMNELDRNGDGVIVLAEMSVAAGFVFADADRDGDGRITRAELSAYFEALAERRAAQIFARFDTDKDGVISRAERSTMNRARFRQLDTDGDGRVTKAELRAALDRWLARRAPNAAREASDEKPPATRP